MADDRGAAHPLAQLLVTEAIREFEERFEGTNNKIAHIESQIRKLGRKPGFAMVSQLLRTSTESIDQIDDIARFLSLRLTPALFAVQAKAETTANPKTIRILFDRLPPWFYSISPAPITGNTASLSPEQPFWWRAYASFLIGVYTGALLHFGLKVINRDIGGPEVRSGIHIVLTFGLEELEGTWEFSAASQH
jgi:hypothetical protein